MRLWHVLLFDFVLIAMAAIAVDIYYTRKICRQAVDQKNNRYVFLNLAFNAEKHLGTDSRSIQHPIDDKDWNMFEIERENRRRAQFYVAASSLVLLAFEAWVIVHFFGKLP
jgi:hypothetical protein